MIITKVHESTGEVIEATTLAIRDQSIVMPAVSVEGALNSWAAYNKLKSEVGTDDDYQLIQGKRFPKKSLWRKMATFFNLSVTVNSEERVIEGDGSLTFQVIYLASAPNGRTSVGDGACNTREKKDRNGKVIENSIHNVRGTAHTRAFNRAVSNLIGAGEVSAEEAERDDFHLEVPPIAKTPNTLEVPKPKTRDQEIGIDFEHYIINLGKNDMTGKTLEQAGLKNVQGSIAYWRAREKTENKPLSGNPLIFLKNAEAWIASKATHTWHKDIDTPPPIDDSDIPNWPES